MFERLNPFKREKKPPKRQIEEGKQLLQIIADIEQSPQLFKFLIAQLAEQSGQDPEVVKGWFKDVYTSANALGLAKKVDEFLGIGTFRKLSFVSKGADAERNVLKILSKDLRAKSFEGQVEGGLYMNIKESYAVEWSLEKAARDILQNFFDGNNQTLDGVEISVVKGGDPAKPKASIRLVGKQSYDWRELVHLGGSTKTESEVTAGGFGEGAKILSLILLRDYGAKLVRFSSEDWEVDFYLEQVPQGSYRKKEDRGLFVRKRKKKSEKGNSLQLGFEDQDAIKKVRAIENSQELFYSRQNPDFRSPSFEDKGTGGFQILPRVEGVRSWDKPKGNLYVAGQRIHYDSRDKWNNIDLINIWTWKKIAIKDRDRGMITTDEMRKHVVPLVVERM